ncbi:hypothetical protein J6P92_02280 [bacterium]|nr:hypothetical protein [bacterium]
MKYFIGLSLSASSGMDSGVAILDEENNIILIDKLYTMNDVMFFFDNCPYLKYSNICVSLVWDRTMLNGKWRVLSKPYQLVATNPLMHNRDGWTHRYSTRGCEYFKSLSEEGIPVDRFELYLTRQSMHLNSCYKERSPADCKFLQQTLHYEWGLDLPVNMMPMSQLEAIIGALLAREKSQNPNNIRKISNFKDFDVIDIVNNSDIVKVY